MGLLYPAGVVEVLPGDVFRHSASLLVRFSPMAAPLMHSVRMRVHHFFVPSRLAWPDGYPTTWENFITGGPGGDESNPLPTLNTTGVAKDLLDYMGLPIKAGIAVNSLPVRGYNLVFNEHFRDQDLVAERGLEDTTVARIAWEKDYFTTARPWPQRGPDVTVPLASRAPVRGIGKLTGTFGQADVSVRESDGQIRQYARSNLIGTQGADQNFSVEESQTTGFPNIWADLSEAAAAKVNDVRRAFALQRFAENRARYGGRYVEYLLNLGVRSSDARLQRPEYLGGGTQQVAVSEVLQTANEAGASTPRFGVGDMYGHGIASTRSNAWRRRFTEHGYIITVVSCRPRQMFTDGIERMWLRRDREDFWQRELQFIGQQAIEQRELFADASNENIVFGYTDRYQEYRYQRNLAVGEFRDKLNYWHLGRIFAQAPALNETFIQCEPSKRVFNVQGEDVLWMAVNHRMVARRLVSRQAAGRLF